MTQFNLLWRDQDMRSVLALSLTPVLLLLVVVASPAHAFSFSTVVNAGAYCTPYYGTQSGDFTMRTAYIQNNNAAARYVTCPLSLNNFADFTGIDIYMRVRSAASQTLSCTLYSYNESGESGGSFFTHSLLTTESVNPVTLHLYAHGDRNGGYSSVLCLLPQNARIYNNTTRNPTMLMFFGS
jgi:hypothetical protein